MVLNPDLTMPLLCLAADLVMGVGTRGRLVPVFLLVLCWLLAFLLLALLLVVFLMPVDFSRAISSLRRVADLCVRCQLPLNQAVS